MESNGIFILNLGPEARDGNSTGVQKGSTKASPASDLDDFSGGL